MHFHLFSLQGGSEKHTKPESEEVAENDKQEWQLV